MVAKHFDPSMSELNPPLERWHPFTSTTYSMCQVAKIIFKTMFGTAKGGLLNPGER